MPGVPPDALAQVKKGLRGLFNRKKSKGASQQQSEPESTSRELPTDNSAAPPAPTTTARAGEDTKNGSPALPAIEAPTSPPLHHISSPPGIDEAKAVELNPTTTTTTDIPTSATTGPAKVTDEGKLAPITTSGIKAESSTGMSATSGPLGDHMAEVYQEVDHDHAEEGGGAGG